MIYKLAADILVIIHLLFIGFVIFGGLLVFRWRWIIFIHIVAVIWGAIVEFKAWICPLTPWEHQLRQAGGQDGYARGFIEHYLIPIIYPENLTYDYQIIFGLSVVIINLAIYSLIFYKYFTQK